MNKVLTALSALISFESFAQQNTDTVDVRSSNQRIDSLYLASAESDTERLKLVHAEPLFIDLIRDLGARKGEREWNIGMGLTDNLDVDRYDALIEYEWAPVDRIGLEVELPISIYGSSRTGSASGSSQINSLKLAAQWTMLVDDRYNTSLALGYIQEFELAHSSMWGNDGERGQ